MLFTSSIHFLISIVIFAFNSSSKYALDYLHNGCSVVSVSVSAKLCLGEKDQ